MDNVSDHELTTADVLFFGRLADTLGRQRKVAIPAKGCTLGELRRRLCETDPDAAEALNKGVRASIEREISGDDAMVRPGQEVAFFPIFSGG